MTARGRFIAVFTGILTCGTFVHAIEAAPIADQNIRHSALHAPQTQELRKPVADIDWASFRLDTDADALQIWKQIAPTGRDWERKLADIPGNLPIAHALALAMLRSGSFTCTPPPAKSCDGRVTTIPAPAPNATLADPCLRRVLALWSFDQLQTEDIPKIRGALRTIAKTSPPESDLVASALRALPDSDIDGRFELLEIAWKAGQKELVNRTLGGLDESHLVDAVLRLHIDGALDVLSADTHRSVYMRAILDDKLASAGRVSAINQLAAAPGKLERDVRALFVSTTRHRDCAIAAAAVRALEKHGDRSFVPVQPATTRPEVMMRSLCVLAAYETQQRSDQGALLQMYLPPRGMEVLRVEYDPYNTVDTDGDGDPHKERALELVRRNFAQLPEREDMQRAFGRCSGTTCTSRDHTFKFMFRQQGSQLVLWRVEVTDRVPCK